MEEELITFETAKLAKEKGFTSSKTLKGYHEDFSSLDGDNYPSLGTYTFLDNCTAKNSQEYQIEVPTQSLLQKWVREKHDLHSTVEVSISTRNGGLETYYEIRYSIISITYRNYVISKERFTTYEEALEVGLLKALKLIKV